MEKDPNKVPGKSPGEKELQAIKAKLEELIQLVLQQFVALKVGLERGDWQALAHLVDRDVNIDQIEAHLDDLGVVFVANRAPMGSSLRFLIGTLDVAAALERIGDCVKFVVRHALETQELRKDFPSGWRLLIDAVSKSLQVYEKATESLSNRDATIAKQIHVMDDAVDAIQDQSYRMVIEEVRAGKLDVELGLHLVLMINKMESSADISCHIADTVVYIVEDARVRHHRSPELSP